jgi:predicted GNAT superfamily acetyltransferase
MTIRPLTQIAEFQRCLELQREAFGATETEVMPARFFVILNHIGGIVLGAFDGDRLVGFLNAMPGLRDGNPYWHSQMLAVAEEYWNAGIGSRLKLAQRDHAIQRGIHLIEWTFDPLKSKNAWLNIEKLGAIVRRYYPNHYGSTTRAAEHGMDTDRVIAEWWINRRRMALHGEIRRVFIPTDIHFLRMQSPQSARDVQLRVREQFLKNIDDDFFVAGFERKDERSEYLFVQGAANAHQAD